MTVREIALIYSDLVVAEGKIPVEEHHAKDQINALRTKYHELLMAKMREEGIAFSDRFDAAQKGFEIARRPAD